MRRRVRAASFLPVLGLVVLAGCSSGSSSSPSTTVAATTVAARITTATTTRATAATTTIPATATTRGRSTTTASPGTGPPRSATTAARTTAVATTVPSPTTEPTAVATSDDPAASTTDPAASTTNVPAAPCDPVALLQAADLAFGPLPPGSALSDPRCVENYASGLLSAPGQDSAFVVFDNFEGEWLGLNLGTDQICSGADVPIEFYGPLNCGPWEG